ncbi:hypothetical protein JL09_g7019, partial [Pichia kudriavzevii]
ISDRFQEASE